MNTLLIGPRACGKSTVGAILAKRLGMAFVDLDQRVLARFSQSTIREVWQSQGEAAWRAAEADELAVALRADNQIIALGGGVPMIPAAAARLAAAKSRNEARVIYLTCSACTLTERLRSQPGDRPRLTESSLADEVAAVLKQRDSTYAQLADIQINTENQSPSETVDRICALLFPPQ